MNHIFLLYQTIDFHHQRLCLIRQQAKAHVFPVQNIQILIDDQIHPFGQGQYPVIRVVPFGDFALFIDQQGHVVQSVFGDEFPV